MGIVTDSTPMVDSKDWQSCNVFKLYQLLASPSQTSDLQSQYEAGNFGYGQAKQALFELIMDSFSEQRQCFDNLMNNTDEVELELRKGAEKAKQIAQSVLNRVRKKIGY